MNNLNNQTLNLLKYAYFESTIHTDFIVPIRYKWVQKRLNWQI